MLEIRKLCKRFKDTAANEEVSLKVAPGEFVTLLGPSGCGKSTTLRMVAGLEKPDSGSVFLSGREVTSLEPGERKVAMVFQDYALFPHLNVFENAAFGLRARGLPSEVEKTIPPILKRLGLEGLERRWMSELSGGQRQRVALARALAAPADLLLFDEPLSNLDAPLRLEMRLELKRLRLEMPRTSLYVTHDQAEAMTLSDRIAVMNKGKIVQAGSPSEIYKKPADRFVASFVGSPPMSFLEASVEGEEEIILSCGPIRLKIQGEKASRLKGLKKTVLGIRPEDVVIGDLKEGWSGKAKILLVETSGPDSFAEIAIETIRLLGRLPSDSLLKPGEEILVGLRPSRIHLFHPETGKAL